MSVQAHWNQLLKRIDYLLDDRIGVVLTAGCKNAQFETSFFKFPQRLVHEGPHIDVALEDLSLCLQEALAGFSSEFFRLTFKAVH